MADKAGDDTTRDVKEREGKDGKLEGLGKRTRGRRKKTLEEAEEAASMLKFLERGIANPIFAKGKKVLHSPQKKIVEKEVDREESQGSVATSLVEYINQDEEEAEGVRAADDGEKRWQETSTGGDKRRDELSGTTDDERGMAEDVRGELGWSESELVDRLEKWENFVLGCESEKEIMKREIALLKTQVAADKIEKDRLREELCEIKSELKSKFELVEELRSELKTHRNEVYQEVSMIRSSFDRLENERDELRIRSARDRESVCNDVIVEETGNGEGCGEFVANGSIGEGGYINGEKEVFENREYFKNMPSKMSKQEHEYEMLERRNRKKNIFIRGLRTVGRGIKEEIRDIINEKMGLSMYIRRIRAIGGGLVIELESMENKREIMKNKKCLKGWEIWIDDDLTDREKEIQAWLVQLKEEERGHGIEVSLGHQKARVQGVWYMWDEKKGRLEEQENKNFRGRRET